MSKLNRPLRTTTETTKTIEIKEFQAIMAKNLKKKYLTNLNMFMCDLKILKKEALTEAANMYNQLKGTFKTLKFRVFLLFVSKNWFFWRQKNPNFTKLLIL